MKFILFISLPLYVLDQWSKRWVMEFVHPDGPPRHVINGFFDIINITNTGAAFGSFKDNNTFFVIISCAALLFVVSLLVRRRSRDAWRDVSLALLLAGVLGNLTDRLLYGHVVDFLLFDLHVPFAHPWPAFNVADACICVAVFCFVIHSLLQKKESAEAEKL